MTYDEFYMGISTSESDAMPQRKVIFALNGGELQVCVSRYGEIAVIANTEYSLEEPKNYGLLVAVLELNPSGFLEELSEKLGDRERVKYFLGLFSLKSIILATIERRSNYWIEQAIKWFGELDSDSIDTIVNVFYKSDGDYWANQKIRQKMQLLAKGNPSRSPN